MTKYRNLDRGDVFPASWTDAIQEVISTIAVEARLGLSAANVVQLPAAAGNGQVGIGIGGLWRYRTTNLTATVSGVAGVKDIFVTAQANSFAATPQPDTDNTVYDFGLEVLAAGSTPSLAGTTVAFRKIGECDWDGAANVTGLRQTVGALDATLPVTATAPWATAPAVRAVGAVGQTANLIEGRVGAGANVFSVSPAGVIAGLAVTQAVDNSTTQIATTAFVVGQGYAKLASPALSGVPTAPTAAVDTNTTQVATTAFVVGQAGAASPLMNAAAAVGTSLRYSRQDHVHPTDTSRAPLASPALTGVPLAPTAVVDTSTTQIATTAFVVGQGYAKLASPALTGVPSAPTAAADTNTTQLATTAFVLAQAGAVNPVMNGAVAVGVSLRYSRQDHVHPTDTSRAPLAAPSFTGTVTMAGALDHDGASVGFYGTVPVAQNLGWGAALATNFTGAVSRKSLTATYTVDQLRDVVATLADAMRSTGLLGA